MSTMATAARKRDLPALTTADLIGQYDLAVSSYTGRMTNHSPRQARIDHIVDLLSQRADAGDPEALRWYDE